MLNSIIKFAVFIAIVAALAFAGHLLLSAPAGDGVTIKFYNYEIPTIRPITAILLLTILFLGLYFLLKVSGFLIAVINFIVGNDSSLTRYFERADERKGAEALAQAQAAIAMGDGRKAKQKAQLAERKLKRPTVTRLVSAQAAELAGDKEKARTYYRALADHSETALVGVKGLLRLAETEGERETAEILARTAVGLKTDDKETLEGLYAMQVQKFDWEGARATLGALKRNHLISAEETARRDANLGLAQAAEAQDQGRSGDALKLAVEAAKIDPSNREATAKAAKHLAETGATKQAAKLIADAWKAAPGPAVASVFADLEPDETPEARRKRFEGLFEANPDHPQTHYTRAELALMEGKWEEARGELRKLNETEPSGRYCAIRAAISRGEGRPESEVRTWLVRGIGAPGGGEGMIADAALLPLLVGPTNGAGNGAAANKGAPAASTTSAPAAKPGGTTSKETPAA
ncbi:MAG: heme biosynthesis HemY N-terminal domain-containing protein [Pseudomonadota bacterium]